jgi:hypothetical protein
MVSEGCEGVEGGHGMYRGWRHFCEYRLDFEDSLRARDSIRVDEEVYVRDNGWRLRC